MIKPRANIGLAALSLTILVSGGCSSLKPTIVDEVETSAPPARPSISPPPSQGQPKVSAPSTKPVETLLARAETEFHTGQLDRSAALLERAIRISPKDPHPWQRLAQVRLQQGNAEQAETLAIKSNSLSHDLDSSLLRTNWEIIAEARRQQADEAGVRQAEDQLKRLGTER
jgi:tetratricopeptide (TPR) repeat protein